MESFASLSISLPASATIDLAVSVETATTPEVTERFQTYIESIGFTSAACLIIDRRRPLAPDNILMCTRPRPWLDSYMEQRQMLADPVLDALRHTRSPFAWSDVIDYDRLDHAGRQVMGHAADFGMEDGFVIPISGSGRTAGLVSVAGPRQELSRQNRAALTLVSLYVHQRLVALRRQETRSPVMLTDRELEIMRWIAEGKSDWQIGQILKISSKTVNYHVENVKRKFGVASRIQAIVATLKEGRLSH